MALLGTLASTAGAAVLVGRTAVVAPPPDAAASPFPSLGGVSCGTATACTAVGGYLALGHVGLPMAASGSARGFARAVSIALPADRDRALSDAWLAGVSCPATGGCVAVGSYENASRSLLPIATAESTGTWSRAAALPLPGDAGPDQAATLASVACADEEDCTAVGSYLGTDDAPSLLADVESSGAWSAVEVASPEGTGGVARVTEAPGFLGVACTTAGDCTAVGSVIDQAGGLVPVRATQDDGTFSTASLAPLPSGTSRVAANVLASIACTAVGWCVAVGSTTRTNGRVLPDVETEVDGRWGPILLIGLPQTRSRQLTGGELTSITCTAARTCLAVGTVALATGGVDPCVLVDRSGHLQQLDVVTTPTTGDDHAAAPSVACASQALCVAVGGEETLNAHGTEIASVATATPLVPTGGTVPSPSRAATRR